MREASFNLIIIFGLISMMAIYHWKIKEKDEHIKQLEQSLAEQIQEVEVYRDILEEYQIEGIINE